MLEEAPDTISASAYGLGSDRARELLTQLDVNAKTGCGPLRLRVATINLCLRLQRRVVPATA